MRISFGQHQPKEKRSTRVPHYPHGVYYYNNGQLISQKMEGMSAPDATALFKLGIEYYQRDRYLITP